MQITYEWNGTAWVQKSDVCCPAQQPVVCQQNPPNVAYQPVALTHEQNFLNAAYQPVAHQQNLRAAYQQALLKAACQPVAYQQYPTNASYQPVTYQQNVAYQPAAYQQYYANILQPNGTYQTVACQENAPNAACCQPVVCRENAANAVMYQPVAYQTSPVVTFANPLEVYCGEARANNAAIRTGQPPQQASANEDDDDPYGMHEHSRQTSTTDLANCDEDEVAPAAVKKMEMIDQKDEEIQCRLCCKAGDQESKKKPKRKKKRTGKLGKSKGRPSGSSDEDSDTY